MAIRITILCLLLASSSISLAQSCPRIDKVPDVNCDGSVIVSVLGDSLVSGTGDTTNDNHGGYVIRVQAKLPDVTLNNLGVAGEKTPALLSDLKKALIKNNNRELREALLRSDIVILDLGRNDRWSFGPPKQTLVNLQSAARLIRSNVLAKSKFTPYVVIANLMLPNRGSQGPWVKALNKLILASHKRTAPADLRFDLVSKRLLSTDAIHPTPKGYAALAAVLRKYLTVTVPKRVRYILTPTPLATATVTVTPTATFTVPARKAPWDPPFSRTGLSLIAKASSTF